MAFEAHSFSDEEIADKFIAIMREPVDAQDDEFLRWFNLPHNDRTRAIQKIIEVKTGKWNLNIRVYGIPKVISIDGNVLSTKAIVTAIVLR